MKKITLLISLISFALLAKMPGDLKLGGYVENNTTIMTAKDEAITNNSILKLEGYWNYKDRGGIETHVILSKTFAPIDFSYVYKDGSLMRNIIDQALMGIMVGAQESITDTNMANMLNSVLADESSMDLLNYLPYSTLYPSDKITLDRAVVKMYLKPFDLFIGRQTIAWGTGYAFNPTDIFNLKNPMDPNAAKAGVNALRMEIPFGEVSGLSLVAVPDYDFKHISGGFRLKGNLGNFDLSLCGIKQMNSDMELFGLPVRIIAGADLAGQIGDVGVWLEGAAINPVYNDYTDFDSIYAQIDAGLDYTFVNGLYVMAEYYYNGLGEKNYKNYNIGGLLAQMAGQMAGFGQHYVMAGFTKDFLNYFIFSTFGLLNATDQSAMFLPALEYSFSDNIALKLQGQIGVGDKKKSEYGSMNSSITFNVTGYF